MSVTQASNLQNNVNFRFLLPDDIHEVKRLCHDWFPIEYPENWYKDITMNPKFFSLAAVSGSKIIGMIVSEVKSRGLCNSEDSSILASYFPKTTLVAYILSLAVVKEYRRRGIGSLLLRHLLTYLTSDEMNRCKAVYLHVLTSNSSAIEFYEMLNFQVHCYLPMYYSIKGNQYDAYSFVLYINGGQPSSFFTDCFEHMSVIVARLKPCFVPVHMLHVLQRLWHYILNGSSYS